VFLLSPFSVEEEGDCAAVVVRWEHKSTLTQDSRESGQQLFS
jgi:hypothetical protein